MKKRRGLWIITALAVSVAGIVAAIGLLRWYQTPVTTAATGSISLEDSKFLVWHAIWFGAEESDEPNATFVHPKDIEELVDADLAELAHYRPILRLQLNGERQFTDEAFKYIGGITELEHLELQHSRVTDENLAFLAGLTQLKELDLTGCVGLEGHGIRQLSKLGRLQKLELQDSSIRELYLSGGFRSLKTLEAGGERLGRINVSSLSSLERLDVGSSEAIDSLVIESLPSLRSATIWSGSPVPPTTFHLTGWLLGLRELSVRVPLRDVHLEQLDNLQVDMMTALSFTHMANELSDASLEYLARLIALRTPDGLHASLERLEMRGNFTAEGLRHVATLKHLKRLSIASRAIKGSGLQYLAELPHLEVLDLRGTSVEPDQLKWLHTIRSLRVVDISQTGRLVTFHKMALQEAMPWLYEVR